MIAPTTPSQAASLRSVTPGTANSLDAIVDLCSRGGYDALASCLCRSVRSLHVRAQGWEIIFAEVRAGADPSDGILKLERWSDDLQQAIWPVVMAINPGALAWRDDAPDRLKEAFGSVHLRLASAASAAQVCSGFTEEDFRAEDPVVDAVARAICDNIALAWDTALSAVRSGEQC